MKKFLLFSIIFLLSISTALGEGYRKPVKPAKNVIVMIPDGTSLSVLTASRWFKSMGDANNRQLAVDQFLCGTVLTHCSNSPIGDSAPTTSCYMTGVPQRAGNVSIYPVPDHENDLIPLKDEMAYQPLATVLEASRILQGKSTGMVVTCEFPHATPADCASHHYNRGNYNALAPQIVYNNLDVMFGGGTSIITDDMKQHFNNKGIKYIENDINAFRNLKNNEKAWALFEDTALPYDIDRDPENIPSIAEMTKKALEILSQNENGFFLMVEGSQVDWGAHDNDAIATITEFIAFDHAVKEVMDFAKKDGETAVVIMPDHGTGGFAIGSRNSSSGYAMKTKEQIFGQLYKYKHTPAHLADNILSKTEPDKIKETVLTYTGIELSDEQLASLIGSSDYTLCDCNKIERNDQTMSANLKKIMYHDCIIGFTTGGHTGEEVFLAAYHPQNDTPTGLNTNIEINQYLQAVTGLPIPLTELTKNIYTKHNEVFEGMNYSLDTSSETPVLTVKKGKKTLTVPAFKSVAYLNGKAFDLGSVTVYIDKNETLYLPASLREQLK